MNVTHNGFRIGKAALSFTRQLVARVNAGRDLADAMERASVLTGPDRDYCLAQLRAAGAR